MTAIRAFTPSEPPCNTPFYNGLDEEGCYYFNARWYDAGTGRFISEDPARDGSNWHVYVSNNPLKYIDPTGLSRVPGDQYGDDPEDDEPEDEPERPQEKDDDDKQKKNEPIDPLDPENQEPNTPPHLGNEIPEEVIEALREAGIPIVGENPTVDDLNQALEDMQNKGVSPEEVKELFNQAINEIIGSGIIESNKVQGAILMGGGIGIMAGSLFTATTIPVTAGLTAPPVAQGFLLGAGISAVGLSRFMGNDDTSLVEDFVNVAQPPMAEVARELNRDIY